MKKIKYFALVLLPLILLFFSFTFSQVHADTTYQCNDSFGSCGSISPDQFPAFFCGDGTHACHLSLISDEQSNGFETTTYSLIENATGNSYYCNYFQDTCNWQSGPSDFYYGLFTAIFRFIPTPTATPTPTPVPCTVEAITVNQQGACSSQAVTFTAQLSSSCSNTNAISWNGGGNPATGTGTTFTTSYSAPGTYTVSASVDGSVSKSATYTVANNSGVDWVSKYPDDKNVNDLASPFRENVQRFITALTNAGATVDVRETYRAPERAYLMHYSWAIATKQIDAEDVEEAPAENICWAQRNADGSINEKASLKAAKEMKNAFNIVKKGAAYPSNHQDGNAIDMKITWNGALKIVDSNGTLVKVTGAHNGADNEQLWDVGSTYGVEKLASDPPHWSANGH